MVIQLPYSVEAKRQGLMTSIRDCVQMGRIRYTYHANLRGAQRRISPLDIKHVLLNGHHEPRKDKFDRHYGTWNYAVRGKTIDGELLRIIVSFEGPNLLVVTAMKIER